MKLLKQKKHDAFYIVDNKGDRKRNERGDYLMKEFKYGTIERTGKQTFLNKDNNQVETFDYYRMRGDDNATSLFKFFSKNTEVEWGQTFLGEEGAKGLNYLTTSHLESAEYGYVTMLKGQFKYAYTIRGHVHSHPGGTPYPSGLDDRGSDIGVANLTQKITKHWGQKNDPFFKIYLPAKGTYIGYDPHSTYQDFNVGTIVLPEIIIKVPASKPTPTH